ncbi:MAG: Holliday junction resolvase RuvX [Cyanobacteriota bacterium]
MHPCPPCSALALDVGRKRIGVAGCDPLGVTVTQLPALHRRTTELDAQILAALALHRRAKLLVVGLPLDAAQQLTAQARHSLRYGRLLERLIAAQGLVLPVVWVNEHATSWAASDRFGLKKDRSGRLDSAAAALLLEQWLREGSLIEPDPVSPFPPL